MRARTILAMIVVLVGTLVPAAIAAEGDPTPLEDSVYGGDDRIFTPDSSSGQYGFGFSATAGYSDPLGLIDFYEFTSLYPQLGTDRIAVFTCPSRGAVTMTAAQAVAVANDKVQKHFLALSEGRYKVEFVVGGDIPAASGGTDSACSVYGSTPGNYPANVNGAMFVENISGGYGGPGSSCVTYGGCQPTWPQNSRAGFVTSSSIMPMVWTHEHGHMLTWPHSGSGAGSAYDNPIGLMSGNLSSFGGAVRTPYETNVANRLASGWISQGRTMIYTGGTIEVDLATAGTAGTQMIVLEVDDNQFWSIGARISDANDPFPSDWTGVEVMYVANCGQRCYPLERSHFTAGQQAWIPGSGRPIHVLGVGESETIGPYGLEVLSRDADSLVLRITDSNDVPLPDDVKRLSGSDRFATSVAVSSEVFTDPAKVSSVFIATGSNFPDALGAAAAAGHLGSPVLLVGTSVPGTVANELARLKPQTIYVVGGTSVVSDAVVAQLGAYGTVKRLSGANRFATSAAVSAEVFKKASAVSTVFIATGSNFPDALGAAAAAGFVGSPVLLVGDTVPAPVAAELARLNPSKIYVVGGTSVVPNFVVGQLGAYGDVERIAGNDRYGTSAQLSKRIFTDPGAVSSVFVATGANFPDALGAAAAAGHSGSPVLLVSDVTVPGSVKTEINRLKPTIKYVVGGTAVIPNAVAAQL